MQAYTVVVKTSKGYEVVHVPAQNETIATAEVGYHLGNRKHTVIAVFEGVHDNLYHG